MCDSEFAKAQIEWQIIRLGSSMPFDSSIPKTPRYAPFVAAGFFFCSGNFLHEVPFDPLLPWIFMGEEISMSARLWTAGYDIFSPTINVLNHYYVRRHYPKFWESVNRFFKKPIHNNLVEIVLKRVKNMLGYPESAGELINPSSGTCKMGLPGCGLCCVCVVCRVFCLFLSSPLASLSLSPLPNYPCPPHPHLASALSTRGLCLWAQAQRSRVLRHGRHPSCGQGDSQERLVPQGRVASRGHSL